MKVLRAIGGFFAKIGRWIRDTAWVQPLLIVGGIFAIVFSIQPTVKWVESWFDSGSEGVAYYKNFRLKLNGAQDQTSEADGLFKYLVDQSNGVATADQVNRYGEKFFVAFVQEDCATCESCYYGFDYLQDNWNKNGYNITDGGSFKLYTIFIDTIDTDDNDANLFQKYFYGNYDTVFETTAGTIQESYYYINNGGPTSNYATEVTKMESEDTFSSPTTFLVDFSDIEYRNEYGVSEVLFAFDGTAQGGGSTTSPQAKARTLCDAWNHEGIFAKDYQG